MRAVVKGTGMYVPPNVVDNHRLSRIMDTSDEWIRQRTGIVTRHFADVDQATSDLAVPAAEMALADAGHRHGARSTTSSFATMTPDYYFPGSGADLPAQARPGPGALPRHPAAVRGLPLRPAARRRDDPLRPVPQRAGRRRRGSRAASCRGRPGTSCSAIGRASSRRTSSPATPGSATARCCSATARAPSSSPRGGRRRTRHRGRAVHSDGELRGQDVGSRRRQRLPALLRSRDVRARRHRARSSRAARCSRLAVTLMPEAVDEILDAQRLHAGRPASC